MATALPDEIWSEIITLGINNTKLTYKDLCCISISSKRLNKLSNQDTLWSILLTLDFPTPNPNFQFQSFSSNSSNPTLQLPIKSVYKLKFEKEKEKKIAAHRRAVYRIESQINVHTAKLKEIKVQLMKENEKLKMGLSELGNLERVRSASVAMNVWQPEIVRGKQKRVVEQCVVPVESRVKGVEMEIRVCKQQIKVLDKGYREELRRLDEAKRKLVSMVYHPLRDYGSTEAVDECKGKTKRKKSKQCSEKFCSSGDKC